MKKSVAKNRSDNRQQRHQKSEREKTNMTYRIMQAYRQAPWRIQLQWMGLFLLLLVLASIVAGFYLNISARAATTGRQIQQLEMDAEQITRRLADLQTKLGTLSSSTEMEKRARELGYRPIEPGEGIFIIFPDYPGRPAANLAPSSSASVQEIPLIIPEYTQSLWDWFYSNLKALPSLQEQVKR